jgi:two-component system nitrate/nitrite response regulator NarL
VFLLAVMRSGDFDGQTGRMGSQQGMRCVIVDDNQEFLHTAAGLLERGGIMVVGIASSADEALRSAARLRPDVILVDVNLGQEDGFELAERLHREGGPDGPAVVLTSTHAPADFAELIANSPAAGFVQKAALSVPTIRGLVHGDSG